VFSREQVQARMGLDAVLRNDSGKTPGDFVIECSYPPIIVLFRERVPEAIAGGAEKNAYSWTSRSL
jgi:hypothetical protein